MKDFVELGIPVLLCLGSFFFIWAILKAFGFPLLNWRKSPESVVPWRHLTKWQFVGLRGIVCYSVPMSILMSSMQYFHRRTMLPEFGRRAILWDDIGWYSFVLAIFIGCGFWIGVSEWRKIWNRTYDPPIKEAL